MKTLTELRAVAEDRQRSAQDRVDALRELTSERFSQNVRIQAADALALFTAKLGPLGDDRPRGDDDHDGFETFEDVQSARERAAEAVRGHCRCHADGELDLREESYLLSDLVTNVLHLADEFNIDPAEVLNSAISHFDQARFTADGEPLRASNLTAN